MLQGEVLDKSEAIRDKFTDEETLTQRRSVDNMKTKDEETLSHE